MRAVSLLLNATEWEELLSSLHDQQAFRVRFGNPEAFKREPDNARLRAALAAGTTIDGAELRREHHVRLA